MFPLESVITQLNYLIRLESGEQPQDRDLAGITIGAIAARDIETFNPGLAETLYDVSAEVRKMVVE